MFMWRLQYRMVAMMGVPRKFLQDFNYFLILSPSFVLLNLHNCQWLVRETLYKQMFMIDLIWKTIIRFESPYFPEEVCCFELCSKVRIVKLKTWTCDHFSAASLYEVMLSLCEGGRDQFRGLPLEEPPPACQQESVRISWKLLEPSTVNE